MVSEETKRDVENLRKWNAELIGSGTYVAFSGSARLFAAVDPSLPYGVVRNGDGRMLDILYPEERTKHPLPDGWEREDPDDEWNIEVKHDAI